MRILLTGGSGFVGRYLKQNLKHDVIAPSSSQLNLLDVDQVTEFLKNHKFDAVIHTAVAGRESVYAIDNSIADKNLTMYFNLANNKELYKTLINFGSGAEFGLDKSIDNVKESEVRLATPKESYGFSKNIISRSIYSIENFYNLRIFSCVDSSEGDNRLIKKFKKTIESGTPFYLDKDRYVDFISLRDICIVVENVLEGKITDRDINLVYRNKLLVSELLDKYCNINNVDTASIIVTGRDEKNYTGNGELLASYDLPLEGLDATLADYKEQDE
jgi:dTDP-4-dehydrorhamnose reductase